MSEIGIISNPYARVNKKDPEHNSLMCYILGDKGQLTVTESLSDLAQVCKTYQQNKVSTIGIIGGDGTISLTLSAIYQAYGPSNLPKILLLRGGTFNVLASNLGISGSPKRIMADFLECFHSHAQDKSQLIERQFYSLIVNGRLGFLFANGGASTFLTEFYKNKSNPIGAGAFITKLMLDGFLNGTLKTQYTSMVESKEMHILTKPQALDKKYPSIEDKTTMIFVSTIPKLPYGASIHREFNPQEPEAELVSVHVTSREVLLQIGKVLLGGKPSHPMIKNIVFSEATIETKPGEDYSLDGDVISCPDGKINIKIGPRFTFVTPKRSYGLL